MSQSITKIEKNITEMMSRPLSSSSGASSGQNNRMPISDMPLSHRQRLCNNLDELNVWEKLAELMSLEDEIQNIRRKQSIGKSPTNELLQIWGGQYNHNVTELFCALRELKLFKAMEIIANFVEPMFRLSLPPLSDLMQPESKPLNGSTSSGVSNSNMTADSNSSWSDSKDMTTTRKIRHIASNLLEIDYSDLTLATDNWSEQNVLGKGGFGTVFKGIWKHTPVAIKQIHYRGVDGNETAKVQLQQSLNELKYLNSCQHDNVLGLYGYSIKGEKPCLVYQLMKGGTLDKRINSKELPPLTWQQRLTICLGTARGINYLHTFRDKPLIHGDIKPQNVLLDQCLEPRLGDFGLAREGPPAINSSIEVTHVFGTRIYLPPEFINSKKLSTQVDTYSFGVLLLETFTGLRAYEKNRSNQLLTKYMQFCTAANIKLEDLLDKRMFLSLNEIEMCKYILQLGLQCIADNPNDRPSMETVLVNLQKIHNVMCINI